ncbi:hypothetical protein ACRFNZ_07675 [Klebsiella quasipneumoniae]|uniref:hypothetical protein n=1 Tax=Klebsiella quasipneumoniae TaxID=1463165 RepID=UPI003D6CD9F6
MFHIDNKSGTTTMPKVGEVFSPQTRFFTEEKDKATWPGADWFNIIQAELLNILQIANITPEKGKFNQIATAIIRMRETGKIYDTPEAGVDPIDGVQDGYFYNVISQNGDFVYEVWKNVNGMPVFVGKTTPSGDFVKSLTEMIHLADLFPEVTHDLTDSEGFSLWRLYTNGVYGTLKSLVSPQGLYLDALSFFQSEDDRAGVMFQDADGFDVEVISKSGVVAPDALRGDGKFSTEYTPDVWLRLQDPEGFYRDVIDSNGNPIGEPVPPEAIDLDVADAQNKAYSQNVRGRYNAAVQRLVSGLIHLIIYSQSLGTQQEGWPAISKIPIEGYDNLMLGDSVRPASRTNPAFSPLGGAVLKPLRAVVQSGTGNELMTDAQVAALAPGAGNEGEGGVAMANALRRLWLQRNCLERDTTRRFVLSSTGVNGRSIEQLSKGASPEIYQRPLQAVQQVKALADQLGVSYSIGAILWIQGEWNYLKMNGSNDKATYKLNLGKLYNDMIADMAVGIAGQKAPPALFMYQTGAGYTRDDAELSIGMAQWEFCQENDNAYMVGPVYHYPDKGGHLGPNGYRWFDMKVAQVMHLVLNEGQGWEPLGPIKIIIIGREIYAFYHVPSPPLVFRQTYVKYTATMYADKGFRVTDSAGTVAITGVEIVADTIIKITVGRDIAGGAKLWYADQTAHSGNGNVFDSDGFNALDNFIYEVGTGQYETENIPELVGKPYPLNNASVQFCLSIPFGE